jgi:hypothetical protein
MITSVHVGRPKTLHIMVLAMTPRNLESRWGYSRIGDNLSRVVGGHASRWIIAKREMNDIRLVGTKNYVPPQTAFYAHWLLFTDPILADEFLQTFPRFNTPNRIEKLGRDRKELAEKVDERLRWGGFDLGKFPPEQRPAIALRFIEADDKLREFDQHMENLKIAEGFQSEWLTILEREIRLEQWTRFMRL